MKKTFLTFVGLAMLSIASGQSWLNDYQNILDTYVTNDGVKYKKLKANDAESIDRITEAIGKEKPTGSEANKLAYYLNAYNAWMLKAVLAYYPTASVLESDSEVFKRKNIKVAGENLYQMLHEYTAKFIGSKHGAKQKGNTLTMSKLFEWFAVDFKKASPDGTVLGFIKQYKKVSGSPSLNYAEYSWKLNED